MREKLTDELMEHIAKKYEEYVDVTQLFGGDVMFTFEQFVERELNFRQFKTGKALEKIEKQKKSQ